MQQHLPRFLLLSVVPAVLSQAAALGQTLPDSWDRSAEWVVQPDSAAGTTQGNPAPDSAGNLVWHHDHVTTGGPLGSPNPWYEEPTTPLVWDTAWFGQPNGAWAISDDFGTAIRQPNSAHIYSPSTFQFQPVTRWVNVTNEAFDLRITGCLLLRWAGSAGAVPMDIDVVIAHVEAATGTTHLRYSQTVSKPTNSLAPESLALPVSIDVHIEPGDELRIAHRAQAAVPQGSAIIMNDDLLMLRNPVGTPYCSPANANSTICVAVIAAQGTVSGPSPQLTLHATGLPQGQFGYFLASQSQGSFVPPGSQGVFCLSGNIGRFNEPAQIIQGPTGSLQVDLTSIPVNPPQAVVPGDTWNFQCWYRDNNPTTTSNFTDGVEVTFQ